MTFDDQIRAALESTAGSLREHLEAHLRAFSQQAVRAAAEERQQAVHAAVDTARAEARSQAEALVAGIRSQAEGQVAHIRAVAQKHADEVRRAAEVQIAELRKALEDLRTHAQQQLDAAWAVAQGEVESAQAEVDRARAETNQLRTEAEAVRTDATAARAEADAARAEIKAARVEAAAARAEADAARADAAAARTDTAAAQTDAEAARAALGAARAEAEAARAELEAARVQAEAVRAQADAVRAEAEAARAEVQTARAEAQTAHAEAQKARVDAIQQVYTQTQQSELARAARLAETIRMLDQARGVSDVLDRLVQCAADEVDRAAMLVVNGDRLRGWRLAGFAEAAPPARSIDLDVEQAGLAGVVLESGVAASRTADGGDGPALPLFAGDAADRDAMALPILVGGEVVAVLYADALRADSSGADARWRLTLEVITRYGSRVLETITVLQAAGLPMPEPMARGSHAAVPAAVEHA